MLRDYNKFINEAIDDDEDLDYLEQMLGRAKKEYPDEPDPELDPEPDNGFKENEIVLYQKNGSERDGETAKFIKIRDDGKYSIRFNDGVKMAVLAKNVYKLEEQPNKNIHKVDVPEDWNKGKLESIETNTFEPGDYVKYIGWNPDYSGLNGTIKKVDNNSHVLMKFDDGRNLWAPFKQLSFKTEQIFSELDPYGEEYWDANESVKNFKPGDIVNYYGGELSDRYGEECEIVNQKNNDIYVIRFLHDNKMHDCGYHLLKLAKNSLSGKVRWYNKGKLEDGKIKESLEAGRFEVGDKVIHKEHKEYGVGTVLKIDGGLSGKVVHIQFENVIDNYKCEDNCCIRGHCWTTTNESISKYKFLNDTPGKIKWYYKGKLDEGLEAGRFEVGDKVIHMKYPHFGVGTVMKTNSMHIHIEFENRTGHDCSVGCCEDGHCWTTDNNNLYSYKFIEDKPGKIKWYYKGKLEENKLFESKEDIGKKVQMRDDSQFREQAYKNWYGKEGDGYGVITEFRERGFDLPYRIKWNNMHTNSYSRKDFDFVDEIAGKVKWYYKGKLEEHLSYEDLYIGMRVKCTNDYKVGGKVGKIVYFDENGASVEFDEYIHGHRCAGAAKHGHGWYVNFEDLEIEKEEEDGKVKWYYKGKLEKMNYINESSDDTSIISIYDLLLKHIDYDEFLEEVERLFLGKRIAIYGLDDENKYKRETICNVIQIGDISYIFEEPSAEFKSYKEYRKHLKRTKKNDGQIFLVKTDKIIKKNNKKINDIEVVFAYDKIVINPIEYNIKDPYGEESWDDII